MPKLSDANHALIERTLSLKTDPNARRMYSANTINQLLDAAREEGVARPLALGGQHSGPPLCEDEGCPQHGSPHICTTPARAEAQDEGAAGEPVAKVVRKGFSTGSISWTKFGQDADLPDETLLYAHPSPTPAADASGVIRVLERICETQKRLYGNGTGLHLAMLDLCIDARAELSLYQAALKSTAAKE